MTVIFIIICMFTLRRTHTYIITILFTMYNMYNVDLKRGVRRKSNVCEAQRVRTAAWGSFARFEYDGMARSKFTTMVLHFEFKR